MQIDEKKPRILLRGFTFALIPAEYYRGIKIPWKARF